MIRFAPPAVVLAVALLAGFAEPTQAGDAPMQALHPINWYADNPAVRRKTIQVCYNDASYDNVPDCMNAARGESLARARNLARQSNILADPQWWQDNQIARKGAATICARGGGGGAYPQYAPYCSLIFAKEIEARG